MSKRFAATVLLALAVATVLMLGSCGKEPERQATTGGVSWLLSIDEARAQAAKQDRPIMIDVYTDWCGWCKRLDSETYIDKDVVAKAGEFVSLKLDGDANRSFISDYRVGGFPTILFIDAGGRELHRVKGYRKAPEFIREMDMALAAFNGGKGS
jgi:thiol:disulfide interchange protein